MNKPTYDVVIVGGGIMGCATAYYLAKEDPGIKVAVIERDPTYAMASTPLSLGQVRIQFRLKENIQISQYAQQFFERFSEEMAVGDEKPEINWHRQGLLTLSRDSDQDELEEDLALQKSMGCNIDWLSPKEIQDFCPLHNLEDNEIIGGVFSPKDGTMNPYGVLMGFKKKARYLGTTFIKDEAAELIGVNDRITGVKLSSGTNLLTELVVNCAGAWAAKIAETVGVKIPVVPIARQVFVVDPKIKAEGFLPVIAHTSNGPSCWSPRLWTFSETGGLILIIKRFLDDAMDFNFNWDEKRFIEKIWPELAKFVPAWDTLKLLRGYAGLYEVNTLDENAIIGEWPELKGLYLANGFSGHGFQQGPGVGRYLSELITDQIPTLDLSIFGPERILENKPLGRV